MICSPQLTFVCFVQGSPNKLLSHLVEEHSAVDPTYVEDLLLTYRTFLKHPMEVADRLLEWFQKPNLKDKVCCCCGLIWVEVVPLNSYLQNYNEITLYII